MGVHLYVAQEVVMKTNSIKTNGLKGIFTKVILAGTLAGAVLMAAPQKAQAQQFAVGVQFGHPVYRGPVYGPVYDRGFYADRRREEFRREEFLRHERWEREHSFYRGYYR